MATIGGAGDLATGNGITWVRYNHEWIKSIIGTDEDGRPLQRHPDFPRRRLYGVEWKSDKKPKAEDLSSQPIAQACHRLSQPLTLRTDNILTIPPQPSTFSEIRPGNEWLRDVLHKWNSPLISTVPSLHSVGKCIIEKLLDSSLFLPPVPNDDLTMKYLGKPMRGPIPPSLKLALTDLMVPGAHCNVCDFLSRSCEQGISAVDVVVSMMNPTTLCDMTSPERRLYGALEIPMTQEGLKLCQYKASPYHGQRGSLIPDNSWTTTLTPPGAITHTHMDCYGRHQFIVHLFGHKLWLLWPPTEENLQKFRPFHLNIPDIDMTLRCIDKLDGLQVFYTTKEQAFLLQPNVLHSCLCIGTSGHSGAWLWTLPAYKESLRMVSWGLDFMKGKLSTDAPAGDFKAELEILENELKSWAELVKLNPGNADSMGVKSQLEFLGKSFSEVTGLYNPQKGKKRKRADK